MVHALQIARNMLVRGGHLINVHDLPVPHVIEIKTDQLTMPAGWLFAKGDFQIERSAYAALTKVVEDGLFVLSDELDFDFRAYVDSLKEFRDWLAVSWETAIIPETTIKRIEEIIQTCDSTVKVVLKSPARMTKLQAI